MEKPMDRTPARDAIADEAVGETLESRAPDAARRAEIAAEEAAKRFARSSGAQASIADQTAESVGERVGDAYADAGSSTRRSGRLEGYQASPEKVARQVTPSCVRPASRTAVSDDGDVLCSWLHDRGVAARSTVTKPETA
jgi:hypothetical protein